MGRITIIAICVLCAPVQFIVLYIIGSIKEFILRRIK